MKVQRASDGRLLFWCEGCQCSHGVTDKWGFNGDFERPTITPSILVRHGRDMALCCHSFVIDGSIQYLNDCTHQLAGKTVELLDVDDPDQIFNTVKPE